MLDNSSSPLTYSSNQTNTAKVQLNQNQSLTPSLPEKHIPYQDDFEHRQAKKQEESKTEEIKRVEHISNEKFYLEQKNEEILYPTL